MQEKYIYQSATSNYNLNFLIYNKIFCTCLRYKFPDKNNLNNIYDKHIAKVRQMLINYCSSL